MTWNNHPITVIKVGIALTLIEYTDIYRGQSFRVPTIDLEAENDQDRSIRRGVEMALHRVRPGNDDWRNRPQHHLDKQHTPQHLLTLR